MPLLVTLNINGNTVRVSQEGLALTNWWDESITDFGRIRYALDDDYGGFSRMSFGSIALSPDLFENDWPPPYTIPVVIEFTNSTEAAAATVLTGSLHLATGPRTELVYDVYPDNYSFLVLDTATDFNGDVVSLPKAFGNVEYQAVTRLPNYSGFYTYSDGEISGTVGVNFHVYDDGVNIDANVTEGTGGTSGLNTFYLLATPVGEVTISGSGQVAPDLDDVIDWAAGASLLNLTPDTTDKRINDYSYQSNAESIAVSRWQTTQMPLIDFLSEITAAYSHLCYIKGTTIYLVDMHTSKNPLTLTEFEVFPSEYNNYAPTSIVRSDWVTRAAVTETIGNYVKDSNKESSRSESLLYIGTTTGTTSNKLVDSNADFQDVAAAFTRGDYVHYGMIVKNTTAGTQTIVTAIDSAAQLTLAADIFTAPTQDYEVGYQFLYGNEKSITPFSTSPSVVSAQLKWIMNALHYRRITIKIPLDSGNDPSPGDELILTDKSNENDYDIRVAVRNLVYDFIEEEIFLECSGTIEEVI